MKRKKLMYLMSIITVLGLVSASFGDTVVVGDFEGDLDGWLADAATLSLSTTGATLGAQAMQVDAEGGWKLDAKLDVKSHLAALGTNGVKITADVTAFDADMTTGWMQVEMIINGQNNDDNGANNNIGWQGLGAQAITRDGQPHTYEWVLPDELTAQIAGADDAIAWFEIALVSNLDGASVTKFYIDNIQISYEEPTSSVLVSDFEGGLDGWYTDSWTAGTVALSTTGATEGAEAMQVEGPGGWQQMTKVDAKPHLAALATPGVSVTVDVTAFPADMTTTWMQVGMVINSTEGVGWIDLGLQGVTLDGKPQTLTWVLPEDATDKVATADETIGWFELLLISNVDEASVAKFYVDNVQIVGIPLPTGKDTDFILGNWEQDLDNWVVGGDADVRYSDTNGVTLDDYSLDVYTPTGAWNTDVLMLNLLDPNQAAALEAFKTNTKITADVTRLVVDWPADDIPGWNEILMVINAGGDGWSLWQLLGKEVSWNQNDGDRTDTATWDYAPYLSQIDFDNLTWCELRVGINANDDPYDGWVWFYLNNMKLSGGGIPLNPQPADRAIDVNVETLLSWSGGMFAASHNLYLGTSRGAVVAAEGDSDPDVLFVPLDGTSFDPNNLDYNTKYFWRIDAVNDVNPDSPWKGVVWEFTTGNFLVVDDFERYANDSPDRIFQTWIDGYGFSEDDFYPTGDPGNGSDAAVGHDIWSAGTPYETLMETETVHGGSQAMPLYYDNQAAGFSEATRTWGEPQDWTINSFNALMLFIHGKAGNVADPLYVTLEDAAGNSATVTYDDPAVFTNEEWFWWQIPVADFAGVDMASIKKMTIGVGSKTAVSGAAGMLLIDDIRVGAQPIGLVAHYELEGNLADSSGNGHDGVFGGDPNFPASYVTGPTGLGQAMLFDGTGGHQNVELGTFNPSGATGQLTVALWARWDGPSDQWQGLIGKRDSWALDDMLWDIEIHRDEDTIAFRRIDSYPGSGGRILPTGVWTHIAATFDGTTARFYIDGEETGNGSFSFGLDEEATLHFGSGDPNGGNAFNGALDDVRIYDIALSPSEISALAGK